MRMLSVFELNERSLCVIPEVAPSTPPHCFRSRSNHQTYATIVIFLQMRILYSSYLTNILATLHLTKLPSQTNLPDIHSQTHTHTYMYIYI